MKNPFFFLFLLMYLMSSFLVGFVIVAGVIIIIISSLHCSEYRERQEKLGGQTDTQNQPWTSRHIEWPGLGASSVKIGSEDTVVNRWPCLQICISQSAWLNTEYIICWFDYFFVWYLQFVISSNRSNLDINKQSRNMLIKAEIIRYWFRGGKYGEFGGSRSTVVFTNTNLSLLEMTLVVRRKYSF